MKQVSIKTLLIGMTIIAAFFAGWATHQISTSKPTAVVLAPDPAILQFSKSLTGVTYKPETLRSNLESLIESKQFVMAMHLLDAVRIDQQIEQDGGYCYYSIAGDAIQNPGANDDYDRTRDYVMPGTGCCVDSLLWVDRAYRFAEKYNSRRNELAE